MEPTSKCTAGPRRDNLSRVSDVEGYLSLLFAVIFLAFSWVDLPLPRWVGPIVQLTAFPLGLLLGVSGVRRGQGGGRIAAWVTLTVSLLIMILIVCFALSWGV